MHESRKMVLRASGSQLASPVTTRVALVEVVMVSTIIVYPKWRSCPSTTSVAMVMRRSSSDWFLSLLRICIVVVIPFSFSCLFVFCGHSTCSPRGFSSRQGAIQVRAAGERDEGDGWDECGGRKTRPRLGPK